MKTLETQSVERNLPNWQERCEFWIAQSAPTRARLRRERESNPLILTGHGLSLRVDKGCLLIRDGNTHYPADRREWRFFEGALDIPPSIIIVDSSGHITLDAIDWLARQSVPLVRLRWDGQCAAVITAGRHAASAKQIRWQEKTRDDPKARVKFALELIQQKALNTLATMDTHVPRSRSWGRAHENILTRTDALHKVRSQKSISDLLGIEGAIAAEYFRAWSGIELRWGASKQNVIPDDWRIFTSRSALRTHLPRNHRATHPVNAMLNYAYGILTARTHIHVMAGGYDPTIGIVHGDRRTRGVYPDFVLDSMEPMRPVVDRAILGLVKSETFTRADFSIQHDGVCRLNPELARRVTLLASNYCSPASGAA